MNDVWSEKRTKHFPVHDETDTVNVQQAVHARTLRRSHLLLAVRWRTSGPHENCTGTTAESWRIIGTGKIFLHQELYRLSGIHICQSLPSSKHQKVSSRRDILFAYEQNGRILASRRFTGTDDNWGRARGKRTKSTQNFVILFPVTLERTP